MVFGWISQLAGLSQNFPLTEPNVIDESMHFMQFCFHHPDRIYELTSLSCASSIVECILWDRTDQYFASRKAAQPFGKHCLSAASSSSCLRSPGHLHRMLFAQACHKASSFVFWQACVARQSFAAPQSRGVVVAIPKPSLFGGGQRGSGTGGQLSSPHAEARSQQLSAISQETLSNACRAMDRSSAKSREGDGGSLRSSEETLISQSESCLCMSTKD